MKDEQDQGSSSVPRAAEEGAADVSASRLRLRSLKVHAFKDVRPGTELQFVNGFHLILGKNGSGKSTLLQLLAAVSGLNFRGAFFADTPFHLEAPFEVGKVLLHAEIRRTFETVRVEPGEAHYLDLPPREEAEVLVRVEHPGVPLCQWVRSRSGEDLHIFTTDPRQEEAVSTLFKWRTVFDPLRLSVIWALCSGALVEIDGSFRVHPEAVSAYLGISNYPGTVTFFDEALGLVFRRYAVMRPPSSAEQHPRPGLKPRAPPYEVPFGDSRRRCIDRQKCRR